MATGATEAPLLLMHWDGSRLQWAVTEGEMCLGAGEEVADGTAQVVATLEALRGKGLTAEEVVWSERYARFSLVPDLVDGEVAFALEHGSAVGALKAFRSERFGDPMACWEEREEAVEEAVLRAWPGARVVSGTLAWLESVARREATGLAVYVDASPGRLMWSRWADGALRGARATADLHPENVLYQIANALHRDGADPADCRLVLSGDVPAGFAELFERFFLEVSELEPFRSFASEELALKPGRWAALWNLAGCAS